MKTEQQVAERIRLLDEFEKQHLFDAKQLVAVRKTLEWVLEHGIDNGEKK